MSVESQIEKVSVQPGLVDERVKNLPLVVDRRRFSEDQEEALEKMSDAGRAAVLSARPEAEFGIEPILSDESRAKLAAIIDEYDIVPPRGWVLVAQMPTAERAGVILIPSAAEQPPEIGIVIAVSEGTYEHGNLVPSQLQMGYHVTFPKFAGITVKLGNVELLQMREDEIMTISRRPGGRQRRQPETDQAR